MTISITTAAKMTPMMSSIYDEKPVNRAFACAQMFAVKLSGSAMLDVGMVIERDNRRLCLAAMTRVGNPSRNAP